MSRAFSLNDFKSYHKASLDIGDVDPSYPMLRYICERFELNKEQRFWLAFLYATCYCGPTVFYIYNEFPDYENVDLGRLERWWKANRAKLFFQTDRARVRSSNQFCEIFESYRSIIGAGTQEEKFKTFLNDDPFNVYERAWDEMIRVKYFGRFSMFLYLESVFVVTGFPMQPKSMNMREAESCRNGLAFAIDRLDLMNHESGKALTSDQHILMQKEFDELIANMRREDPRNTVWNVETTLCAYKKYKLGKRYVGYYIERQREEIAKMQANVRTGVDWSVLWDFRKETFQKEYLKERK